MEKLIVSLTEVNNDLKVRVLEEEGENRWCLRIKCLKPVLIYISLLIISCMIRYMTNNEP